VDTLEKLALLGSAAQYEVANDMVGRKRKPTRPKAQAQKALCVGEATEGRPGTLLRVLQSSRCEQDCAYCPLRRSNDPQRATFAPDELAGAFLGLWQRGKVDGLMLSSAADGGPDRAMAGMLDTVRILRQKHQFEGYVHIKVLPGAAQAALEEASSLADRLSLNIEVPGEAYLTGLHTGKRWQEDLLQRLAWLHRLDQEGAIRSGVSSQLLIGVAALGEQAASDKALAQGSQWLRREFALRRVHFGNFTPTNGTPLAEQAAPDPRRRARLYQWEWLASQYHFAETELDHAFDERGNLPLSLDPKLAVSLARPNERPVEVNTASYEELLRAPGIGPVSARRIVDLRHLGTLRDLTDLRALGVATGRVAPFVLLNGRRPPEAVPALRALRVKLRRAMEPQPEQLRLFPDDRL